jgi:hypothetical protein
MAFALRAGLRRSRAFQARAVSREIQRRRISRLKPFLQQRVAQFLGRAQRREAVGTAADIGDAAWLGFARAQYPG